MSIRRTAIVITLFAHLLTIAPAALHAQDACPPALTFYAFNGETKAQVTAEAGINLRAEPSTGAAILRDLPNGADVVIDADATPVCADGYHWQRVSYAGSEGWVAEGRGGDTGYNLAPILLRVGTQGRVSYQMDDRFANRTEAQTVAPDPATGTPGYDEIQFTQYQYAGMDAVDTPYLLRLYRTDDLPAGSPWAATVEQVRDALHARVNQEPYAPSFPLLPPLEGSDVHHAQTAYIDFGSGAGVWTLVAFTPDDGGATALVARYLGLTYDGLYLLSLTVPVETDGLAGLSPEAVAAAVETRLPDAFTPRLDQVKGLARSVRVDSAERVVNSSDDPLTTARFAGITFAYPTELARRVEFDLIAPIGDIVRMSNAGPQPGRTRASFVGFPNINRSREPHILVVDAANAPANASQFEQTVASLRALIESEPVLATAENPQEDAVAQALLGPGEPLFIQPAWVTFDGGRGIRYLTTFTQNHVSDVRPQSLYYVFEGLTDDGSALVYAQFPLDGSFDLATLPLDTSNIEGGVAGLYEREAVYVADVSRELDGIEAGAFTPDLTALDAIIGSLSVR